MLIVGVLSGAWIWQASATHTRHAIYAESEAKKADDIAQQYVKRTCTGLEADAALVCVYDAIEAAQDKKTAEYDLAAQRQMADWSFWMALAAMVGLGATVVGVYFVWGTLETANRTADIAAQAYAADHRTWLKIIPNKIGPITYSGSDFKARFSMIVQNIGARPAHAVHVDMKAFHSQRHLVGDSALKNLILLHDLTVKRSGLFGSVLLPGETHEYIFSVGSQTDPETEVKDKTEEASIAAIIKSDVAPPAGPHHLCFAFCVSYSTPGSDMRRHSGHIALIGRKGRLQWVEGKTVQPDNLKMTFINNNTVID